MSTEQTALALITLREQLDRPDLRGIIAITNGPVERDVDVTGCIELALAEIDRLGQPVLPK